MIAGHLRSVIGTLTADDLFGGHDRPADQVRSSSADEMGALGLEAVSLRLRAIDDLDKAGKSGSDPSCRDESLSSATVHVSSTSI